jgi:hypothetical protein
MSNFTKHAQREFRAAGWINEHGKFRDDLQSEICQDVLDLLEIFAQQGHSGTTAPYTIELFAKLARFEPIVAITGQDWEWQEVDDERGVWQNLRCSHVFISSQEFNGQAYDIDGRVFWSWIRDSDGKISKSSWTNADSRVPVTFPYTPSVEWVFVPTREFPNEFLDGEL